MNREPFANSQTNAIDQICATYINDTCKPLLDAYNNGPPHENEDNWNHYQSCVNQANQECVCKNKSQVESVCYTNLLNEKMGESRALGCYDLPAAEQKKCFEDPHTYLCQGDKRNDYFCKDIEAQCTGFCADDTQQYMNYW